MVSTTSSPPQSIYKKIFQKNFSTFQKISLPFKKISLPFKKFPYLSVNFSTFLKISLPFWKFHNLSENSSIFLKIPLSFWKFLAIFLKIPLSFWKFLYLSENSSIFLKIALSFWKLLNLSLSLWLRRILFRIKPGSGMSWCMDSLNNRIWFETRLIFPSSFLFRYLERLERSLVYFSNLFYPLFKFRRRFIFRVKVRKYLGAMSQTACCWCWWYFLSNCMLLLVDIFWY